MPDFPAIVGHHYEAEVTPDGYGSRILVDGVEMPEVKAFRIEATVDKATLDIEVIALAKVSGVIERVRLRSEVVVLLDETNTPIRVLFSREELPEYLRAHPDHGFCNVPAEFLL